jgi:hypothetical protein
MGKRMKTTESAIVLRERLPKWCQTLLELDRRTARRVEAKSPGQRSVAQH